MHEPVYNCTVKNESSTKDSVIIHTIQQIVNKQGQQMKDILLTKFEPTLHELSNKKYISFLGQSSFVELSLLFFSHDMELYFIKI